MSTVEAVQTNKSTPSTTTSGMVLQRKCACGGSPGFCGQCTECKANKLLGKPLQKKLAISEPGDEFEQEADRVAEQVMRMPSVDLGKKQPASVNHPVVQRRVSGSGTDLAEAPPIVHDVLRSSGRPLDSATRAFFEPRFGYDIGHVRIHSNVKAGDSACALNALGYTVGHNIILAPGKHPDGSPERRALIAHELVHVLQQTMSTNRSLANHISQNSFGSEASLQRQTIPENERINRLNFEFYEAIRLGRWQEAAVKLNGFNDHDIDSKINELTSLQRGELRNGAVTGMPGWSKRVVEAIENEETKAGKQKAATHSSGSHYVDPRLTVVRPGVLALQEGFTLYQVTDMDDGTASRIPEGRLVSVIIPARAGQRSIDSTGFESNDLTSPAAGTSMSLITNINRMLMSSGFSAVPGGNGIGLIGFPRLGTPGAIIPESFSTWGHTAVYARVKGQVVIVRGYTTGSMVQAALRRGAIQAGTEAIPASISNDLLLFTKTGARAIEFPVSAETASVFVKSLPMTGAPPPDGPILYTGRPAAYSGSGATNCVGWACARVEGELGGKVGTKGPSGQVSPIAEPLNPRQGLQGRFMQATAETAEISKLPGATGEAVVSGMPRYLQVLKWGGRVFIVVGATMVVVETVRAPEGQKGRTLAGAGGGFVGGLALGATAGLVCGPGALACSIVLGLGFGLAGYLGGRALGEGVFDAATGG